MQLDDRRVPQVTELQVRAGRQRVELWVAITKFARMNVIQACRRVAPAMVPTAALLTFGIITFSFFGGSCGDRRAPCTPLDAHGEIAVTIATSGSSTFTESFAVATVDQVLAEQRQALRSWPLITSNRTRDSRPTLPSDDA